MAYKEESRDLKDLWQEAMTAYTASTEKNLEELPLYRNITDVMNDAQLNAEHFDKFRHPPGLVNKLRTRLGRHIEIIQSSAQLVVAAATPASKDVSADYDKIISYFDVTNSLLERISLLESKLPTVSAYQTILIRVFSSLIIIGGIATQYMQNKRLKKWVSALLEGSDGKLKSAYTTMEESIRRLESATMFATLANTQDIKADARETLGVVTELRVEIREGRVVASRTQVDVKEIKTDLKENLMVSQQHLLENKKIEATLKEIVKQQERLSEKNSGKQSAPSTKAKDPNSRRHYALTQVKRAFSSNAKPTNQESDIAYSFVEGTSKWIFKEESYSTWLSALSSTLWVHGAAGIGKSCLAYSVLKRLKGSVQDEEQTSIAYFYFREEHEELRSVKNALSWMVIQTAESDPSYCERAAADLDQNGTILDTDLSAIWDRFFGNKFTKDSNAKLYLIFDGLDEADANERSTLLELLTQIRTKGLNICVLITSRSELKSIIDPLSPEVIEMTKAKISEDIQRLIRARFKTLSRLRKFRPRVKRKVITKVHSKADNMLYAEHILRRLNSIGREGAVLKEIELNLPEDLQSLYAVMLSECQRHRTPDQFKTLKRLFAWLAFSKRPLSFGEAKDLVSVMTQEGSFSIEDEIQGRSARILGFTAFLTDDMRPFEDLESDEAADEEDPTEFDDDGSSPLRFQERSLREYFRAMDVDETGLRTSPSSAHLTIFEMITHILSQSSQKEGAEFTFELKEYAAQFWAQHFLDIIPSAASEDELIRVIESLALIMTNHNNVASSIEDCYIPYPEIFGESTERHKLFVDAVKTWAKLGSALGSEKLTRLTKDWVQDVSISPRRAMVLLARGHTLNWFEKVDGWKANRSYECVRAALLMTDLVPALQEEPLEPSADTVLLVSNAFEDIGKDSRAHRAIGDVLNRIGSLEAAENELKQSVEKAATDLDRFYALVALAQVYKKSSKDVVSKTEEAHRTINEALAIRPQSKDGGDSDDIASQIQEALIIRAEFEQIEGNIDKAMKSYDEARQVRPESPLEGSVYNTITLVLETDGRFSELIAKVEGWTEMERLLWLVYQDETYGAHERFRKAVQSSGKGAALLVKCYQDIIKFLDRVENSNMPRYHLAVAYRTVLKDNHQAKSLLYSILDKGISIIPWTGEESAATGYGSISDLTEIIHEEFRSTSDPEQKAASLQEMRNLMSQPLLTSDRNMSLADSQTAVALAIMTKKIGLSSEFGALMRKIFDTCVEGLSDGIGWNDSVSFRLLAKTLACVSGLERDSQIACSCQFSIVDPTLFPISENEDDEKKQDEKEGNAKETENVKKNQDAKDNSDEEKKGDIMEDARETSPGGSPEDLAPSNGCYCNGCGRSFRAWTMPIYYCILCSDCDLCEMCYQKRRAFDRGNGEEVTYCGRDHRYIRGPMDGWKGVKDGVITIGEEKVTFDDWLTGLKDTRWKEAWEMFWKEDPVRDII